MPPLGRYLWKAALKYARDLSLLFDFMAILAARLWSFSNLLNYNLQNAINVININASYEGNFEIVFEMNGEKWAVY